LGIPGRHTPNRFFGFVDPTAGWASTWQVFVRSPILALLVATRGLSPTTSYAKRLYKDQQSFGLLNFSNDTGCRKNPANLLPFYYLAYLAC